MCVLYSKRDHHGELSYWLSRNTLKNLHRCSDQRCLKVVVSRNILRRAPGDRLFKQSGALCSINDPQSCHQRVKFLSCGMQFRNEIVVSQKQTLQKMREFPRRREYCNCYVLQMLAKDNETERFVIQLNHQNFWHKSIYHTLEGYYVLPKYFASSPYF